MAWHGACFQSECTPWSKFLQTLSNYVLLNDIVLAIFYFSAIVADFWGQGYPPSCDYIDSWGMQWAQKDNRDAHDCILEVGLRMNRQPSFLIFCFFGFSCFAYWLQWPLLPVFGVPRVHYNHVMFTFTQFVFSFFFGGFWYFLASILPFMGFDSLLFWSAMGLLACVMLFWTQNVLAPYRTLITMMSFLYTTDKMASLFWLVDSRWSCVSLLLLSFPSFSPNPAFYK